MPYSKIKGATFTLKIEEVNSYGCGVAHADDGRVVFVNGAVTGDVLLCEIIKTDKRFSVARILELVEPSPHRSEEPFCSAPNACGGCTYRHMKYSSEKETKRGMVADAFRRAGISDAEILPVLSTDETKGYRNKVIYPISNGKKGLIYGYYAQSSHKVIPCDSCSLTNPTLSSLASRIVAILDEHKLTAYDEKSGKGLIRHLYMRIGEITGEILICLVINGKGIPEESGIAKKIKSLDKNIVGVLINSNEKNTNVILGDKFRTLLGRDFIYDVLCGKTFKIHASAFWQVNRKAAELLYNTAFDMAKIKDGDTVADLYCGIGSVGIAASDRASRIFGIEIVSDAVKCARENASLNLVENAEYICADAANSENAMCTLFDEYPDALCILDPPRKGCGTRLMKFLASKNAKKILYISCNPYSLATDIAAIIPEGYEMSYVQPVDLFPRTAHVETVVLLSRKSAEHCMKLHAEPFEMIKSGRKTIELRLWDEKRQKIKTGDTIVFTNTISGEKLQTTVLNLHRFDSFEELYKELPLLKCGYTEDEIDTAQPSDMEKYYSADEQAKHGVVGIEISPKKQATDEFV